VRNHGRHGWHRAQGVTCGAQANNPQCDCQEILAAESKRVTWNGCNTRTPPHTPKASMQALLGMPHRRNFLSAFLVCASIQF
jgi:hypothetical protein